MSDLPKTVDIVVVGGGSVGTSIAYHLARMGGKVVLVEKEAIASGSTGRAAGLITQQYKTELQIKLAQESLTFFKHLASSGEYGLVFCETGYLHLLCSPEELAAGHHDVELQRRLGVDSRLLTPAETARLMPGLETGDILGATNCPQDGYTDPHLATNAFATLAKEHGAQIFTFTEVVGIDVADGRVQRVRTTRGDIQTGVVVNAAGPWAALVGEMVGLDLPVRPFRRQLWFTLAVDEVASDAPVLFDTYHDFYFRKEGTGVLMCLGNPTEPCSFDIAVDWSFASKVAEYATHRFPPFAKAQIASAWAAPRDMTPDHEPVLGFIPGVEGFVTAAGGSGHGFMLAPAVGRLIAELILQGESSLDLTPLTIQRFLGRQFPLSAYSPVGA